MRLTLLLALLFSPAMFFSQNATEAPPNTEVYLFDMVKSNGKITLSNPKNISDNEGYDNQPSFLNDEYVLFSSNRNGQTDIAKYFLTYNSKTWMNFTPGSEYSPLKIPGQNSVSAINLQTDGTQKLHKYSLSTGQDEVLVEDIVIGYQLWYDENTLISAVLEDDMLNLYKTDITNGKHSKLASNIGRSLHKIPNSKDISYVFKGNPDHWQIRSMNINNGNSKLIMNTLEGSEDMAWLKNGSILMGKGSKIFINAKNDWKEWTDLKKNGITNITRIAINDKENRIALVGESNGALIVSDDDSTTSSESNEDNGYDSSGTTASAEIVQRHIKPFNEGNLEGFLEPFDEDVVISTYPNTIVSQGKEQMRKGYQQYFKNNENPSVSLNKRMVLKNYVIDEELATQNNTLERQITIYTTGEGKIKSATFIPKNTANTDAEEVINQQLKAYNQRDIDGFMDTYSNDIKLFNFPNEETSNGADEVRTRYDEFFKRTPDLRGVVKERMVLGNIVVDYEEVTINGKLFEAIAIYEVTNNKISRVAFIN